MKKYLGLVFISILGGAIALGGYKMFFEEKPVTSESTEIHLEGTDGNWSKQGKTTYVSHPSSRSFEELPDFTEAASSTVKAVVHVKNVEIRSEPRTISEYLRGMRGGKVVRGMGSGVIVTPDGYIVTNNHVIAEASELDVTLNNNQTYKAKVVGTYEEEDIALLKIDEENLDYLPFGDSDHVQVGQWVLAVGNPFNLNSTVTAGIISAKGRNFSEGGRTMQSYLQTDAAVNPGNSGGALVNIEGELIGINSAITSQTGTYIGYSFAIPSNNARKIVEDLLEYGDVKNAILGISASSIDAMTAQKLGLPISQGVYVGGVSDGAKIAGLTEGDLITHINGVKVRKLSDLTAYIGTKRPGDKVQINYLRGGKERMTKIELTEYVSFVLEVADLEITNANPEYLANFRANNGVRIVRATSNYLKIPQDQYIIVAIDGTPISSVAEAKKIMREKHPSERTQITFQNREGQAETYSF